MYWRQFDNFLITYCWLLIYVSAAVRVLYTIHAGPSQTLIFLARAYLC